MAVGPRGDGSAGPRSRTPGGCRRRRSRPPMLALAPPGAAHDLAGERRATGALAQDLLVEGLRLRLGLDAELAAEHAHAVLVVAQRRAAPTEIRVQPHQRAVRRLLQ